MRVHGTFEGHTHGLGFGAGAAVVLAIAVVGIVEADKHARALGHATTAVLGITEVAVGTVAGLVVVAVLARVAVYLRRNWVVTRTPSQPGTELEPASQDPALRAWGLPVGHYAGQPVSYRPGAGQIEGTTGGGKTQPAIESHHHEHLHFHGEDPVEMARQWKASQRQD